MGYGRNAQRQGFLGSRRRITQRKTTTHAHALTHSLTHARTHSHTPALYQLARAPQPRRGAGLKNNLIKIGIVN